MKVSQAIVAAIRGQNPPGRFIEKHPRTGRLYDIGDKKAVEKTSQALREGAPKLRSKIIESFVTAAADNIAAIAVTTNIGNTSVTDSLQQVTYSPLTVGGHYLPPQAAAMGNTVASMEHALLDPHLTLDPNTSMYQTIQNTNYHQPGIPTAIDQTLAPMDATPFLVSVPLAVEQMQPQVGLYVPVHTVPKFDNVAPQHTFYYPGMLPEISMETTDHLETLTENSQSGAVSASVLPSEELSEATAYPTPPLTSPTDDMKDEATSFHLRYDTSQTSEGISSIYPSQSFPFDYVPVVRHSMFRDSNLSTLTDYSAMLQQSLNSFEYEDLENLLEDDQFVSDMHMATCFRSSSRFSRGSRTVPRGDSLRSILSGLSDISDALSAMQMMDEATTNTMEGDGMRRQSVFFEAGNHPTIRRGGFALGEFSRPRASSKQSSMHSKHHNMEGSSNSSPADSNPNPLVRFSIPSLSNSNHVDFCDFDEYISGSRELNEEDHSTLRRLVGPLGLSLLQRSSISKFSMLTDAASFLKESELEEEDEAANADPLDMWRASDTTAL